MAGNLFPTQIDVFLGYANAPVSLHNALIRSQGSIRGVLILAHYAESGGPTGNARWGAINTGGDSFGNKLGACVLCVDTEWFEYGKLLLHITMWDIIAYLDVEYYCMPSKKM